MELLHPYICLTFPFSHQGECDLLSLLQVMVVVFGDFPPVCMQPHPEPEQAPCKLCLHRQEAISMLFQNNTTYALDTSLSQIQRSISRPHLFNVTLGSLLLNVELKTIFFSQHVYEFVVTDSGLSKMNNIFIGWLQFHKQAEVLSNTDGSMYLDLTGEDDLPFQEHETNC